MGGRLVIDVAAAEARAVEIWTDERWAELVERRHRRAGGSHGYPTRPDIRWLEALGVYQVPRLDVPALVHA